MKKIRKRVVRFLLYSVPIGLLVTAVSALTQWWWALDLLTHFRVQYILFGLLILPVYFWLKQYYLALIITMVIAIHAASLWPYLHAPQAHADITVDDGLTIMFANTYYKSDDYGLLTDSIQKADPDIIALAEVQPKIYEYLSEYFKVEYSYQYYAEGKGAYDMALFSKIKPDDQQSIYFTPDNPSLYAEIIVDGQQLHILSIHPHSPISAEYSKLRNIDLQQAFHYVDKLNGAVVLVGDFNTTQFSPFLQQLVEQSRLKDTQLEFGLQPSWHAGVPKLLRIPIDHAMVTPEVNVISRRLGEPTGSDHLPVVIKIDLSN